MTCDGTESGCIGCFEILRAQLVAVMAERDASRVALRKFGHCKNECAKVFAESGGDEAVCDCGYEAALKGGT